MLRLAPITPDNWRPDLSVASDQERFVSNPARLLARAYAFRRARSRAFVIEADGVPVGMALYYDLPAERAYDLSQLFIDRRFQRRGYGLEAARRLLGRMEADGRYDRVVLCYIEGNDAARRLYERLGFRPTGARDGDEIIMEKALRARAERLLYDDKGV